MKLTRREFIKYSGLSIATSPFLAGSCTSEMAESEDVPLNVLMLILDDQNDWVGFLGGHPQGYSPHIDGLASMARPFMSAYCDMPLCNPSRVATMTGLGSQTTGIVSNLQPGGHLFSMVDYFKANGYETVRAGKVYHAGGGGFNSQAWDKQLRVDTEDPKPLQIPMIGSCISQCNLDAGPLDAEDDEMLQFRVAQLTAEYLQEDHAQPFFVAMGCTVTHQPWYVPVEYFKRFPSKNVELPRVYKDVDLEDVSQWIIDNVLRKQNLDQKVRDAGAWRELVRGYLAATYFADTCIGIVLDRLSSSPYASNTIVVLWSDHGFHLGEREHWQKQTLSENALRIPLIIHVPGMLLPGTPCYQPVSLLDLFPTLTELAQTVPPTNLEGRSLVPLLDEPGQIWDYPVLSHLKLKLFEGTSHSVRYRRWRYTRYEQGDQELYDIASDPHERRNLATNMHFRKVVALLDSFL